MIFQIKESGYKAVEVDLVFPFFRYCSINKFHACYCKFESFGKFSKIEESQYDINIQVIDDLEDVLKNFATMNMLKGVGEWAVIDEAMFDTAHHRLIDKVGKI